MKAQIETAFRQCLTNHCLVVQTTKEFDIAEEDKSRKCYIVKNSTTPTLEYKMGRSGILYPPVTRPGHKGLLLVGS